MTPRLVIFCSDIESDLQPAMDALNDVFEHAKVSAPRLVAVVPPAHLRESGFRALSIQGERLTAEESARRLSEHLHAVTRTFARQLREEVLGVYSNVPNLEAQACFHPPGGFPRSGDGDAFQVLRQAAGWLETDANGFLGWFGAYDAAITGNVVAQDEAGVPRAVVETDTRDDEDAFVESRLMAARELMSRYRAK